ncbi:putative bifunctional diguanylate cyclase/phosphodiesterase [Undibacter mobilis]|uniref:EAL domain-containing protein n=1 Tax=Undibacter mobilis TaxID=2292256 RepID=A0A371B426_9BRAD|nr:EAL domain-containing protein [Undibacter mobilis]RDV02284.1 EAL domain-containing protein [Undibacter mobilis]
MLFKQLMQIRRADAELPNEVRAALVESLFAPIASLAIGAINCSIIGMLVAWNLNNQQIMLTSAAILAVGALRVVSALYYRRSKKLAVRHVRFWEAAYEYGAWGFSALLGLLCWLTLTQTDNSALQMAVVTTATGYAAAIAGRNAGRPFIAGGQFTLVMLPIVVGLLIYPDWTHKVLGFVGLLFIYGMMDITLGIRDVIFQALIMTRKEAALAARFEEQANRFDAALNNMSHGLCMLDARDRLQVWNERFLELLHLQNASVRVGMRISQIVRHSLRARNHNSDSVKLVVHDLVNGLRQDNFDQFQVSLDGSRTLAISRRMMPDGGSVVIFEDVTERNNAQEKIARLARFDELTGLANRTQFRERIGDMLAAVKDRANHLAIHLIDLDRFKTVNDTLGHPIGDLLLKEVAARLTALVRPGDMITRFGGDEFVILQTNTPRQRAAHALASRIAKALKEPFHIAGHRIDVGASIGIAMAPHDGVDADELIKKADMALYAAKSNGGGNHRFFAIEMEDAAQERRSLELDLREAIALDQFQLHYQPLVDLHTGRVTTCEALLRWTHPVRGNIPPAVFIPVAEETGLIIALGEWALNRACADASSWPREVRVAVNLSPVQFRDEGLGLQVVAALAKSGLSAQRLELEVTERLLLEDNDNTLDTMHQLHALGVSLSLDDFGTGYSSLNYLRKFPFQKIKIDRSFITDLGDGRDARAIIGAVASLGAGLDKTVVAEGIETEEQMNLVRSQGCHEGQGYLFGKPMPADDIRSRLDKPIIAIRRVA